MVDTNTYTHVIAEDGRVYICPLGLIQKSSPSGLDHEDHCVEEDVVGRYSGHLNIVRKNESS